MNSTTLLAPVALVAGLFATQSQAHDVVVTASIPGVAIVIGNPAPVYVAPPPPVYVAPAPVYVETAPVYVEPAPVYYRPRYRETRVVYRRPPPPPVVVVDRPRYDDRCDHRDDRGGKWKKPKHNGNHGSHNNGHHGDNRGDHHDQFASNGHGRHR